MLSTFPPSPTREQTTGKRSATTRWLALAGIIGPILFIALIALSDVLQYHFLVRYGYSPVTESPVSVNALGP